LADIFGLPSEPMEIPIVYREMMQGEESQIFAFVSRVFNEFVAPEFSQEGIDAFMKYIQPEELAIHIRRNHFVLIAELSSEIIGVIAIRDNNHIALLFVDSRFQRRGVGRQLFGKALEVCRCDELGLSQITVNASLNSIKVYGCLGFTPTDVEQCVNGIRFVPMVLRLSQVGGD